MARYRFADFILSPRRRTLTGGGRELPLIPRYFDLLVFLVERRHEAVHRRDIFDHVWNEVIVSDSALSQAIRTLRRTLDDDPREPRFIRTVARHGYQFIYPHVIVEDDDSPTMAGPIETPAASRTTVEAAAAVPAVPSDRFEPLLERLTRPGSGAADEEERREAAEVLHTLGTSEALRRLGTRPRHAYARALLRDTRWDVAAAGAVPLVGNPGTIAAAAALVALRLRRGARAAAARWAGASIGAGLAGMIAGGIGGVALATAPGSTSPIHVAGVLAFLGAGIGAFAGAGVGAGLTIGEVSARSNRLLAVVASGAFGGGVVGSIAQWLGRWTLDTIVGVDAQIGGAVEGVLLGALSGFGYAVATRRTEGGLAAPRGRRRFEVVAVTAISCAAGGICLALAGRPLVGGTIHAIAQASPASHALLTPLGRLLGETDFGPVTRTLIAAGESGFFGAGLALGLTRSPRSHELLTTR